MIPGLEPALLGELFGGKAKLKKKKSTLDRENIGKEDHSELDAVAEAIMPHPHPPGTYIRAHGLDYQWPAPRMCLRAQRPDPRWGQPQGVHSAASPRVPSGTEPQGPTWVATDLLADPLVIPFHRCLQGLTPLLVFLAISFQINYLHSNPGPSAAFGETQTTTDGLGSFFHSRG